MNINGCTARHTAALGVWDALAVAVYGRQRVVCQSAHPGSPGYDPDLGVHAGADSGADLFIDTKVVSAVHAEPQPPLMRDYSHLMPLAWGESALTTKVRGHDAVGRPPAGRASVRPAV